MTPDRELWFDGPRQVSLRQGAGLPPLANGEVMARALCSGISQGTELLLYRGEGPQPFDPSFDAPDTPTYPRRYGYGWIGEIVESRAPEVPPGQRVFALRPHGDLHVLAANQLRLLPSDVAAPRATLAPSLETALNVVWDAGVSLGDNVVILGGGMIGLLVGFLAKRAGAANVHVIEPSPRRRAAALLLGIDVASTPRQDRPRGDADVVIEATGDPASLDRAILHAGQEATIVAASFYGRRQATIALGSEFHRRRLQLKASQVSFLPPLKAPRWDLARRFSLILDCLADARLDVLLEPPIDFAQAPSIYARLDANPGAFLHTVFTYSSRDSP